MRSFELNKIQKSYFGYEDIARTLGISAESARVSASRYATRGILIRLKRNIYVLRDKWNMMEKTDKFKLANLIQVPSYISLMTAMDYYQITTQMQKDFIESIAVKRTLEKEIETTFFNFSKIRKALYFGFVKDAGFFIATPEKAILDATYLTSIGRYRFDFSSIDFGKLNATEMERLAGKFPVKTNLLLSEYESISTT